MAKAALKTNKAKKDTSYVEAVGRRKEAVARVRLYRSDVTLNGETYKKGSVVINNKTMESFHMKPYHAHTVLLPLAQTGSDKDFVVSAKVEGGGWSAQLEAIGHGIARALSKVDEVNFKPLLHKLGLLTRDARAKERRKVGMGGKARREKQSPKR